MLDNFPNFRQLDQMDCGPTCLKIISSFYGKDIPIQKLRKLSSKKRAGTSLVDLSLAAEQIGFKTLAAKLPLKSLITKTSLPCILHWNKSHFVILYKVTKKNVYISDPAHGKVKYKIHELEKFWANSSSQNIGIALILEPTRKFFELDQVETDNDNSFSSYLPYLTKHKKLLIQLGIGFLVGTILQFAFPFLTQSLVDVGISNQNVSFVYLILIAQLTLFLSQTAINIVRSWILLFISVNLNVTILSEFLIKIMKLPIGFFETRQIGDLLQRIGDHKRIEIFLTSTSFDTIFSLFNILVFSAVLLIYDSKIFFVFTAGSSLYILWILLFMKKRKDLDYKRFNEQANNQSSIVHLIKGMQEIKLNNSELEKRWEWEQIQARIYDINIQQLKVNQFQSAGGTFINEGKNILISFLAATAVIEGSITLGMMLAIQYIVGQLNSPINRTFNFLQSYQDAKLSLERLNEVHSKQEEKSTFSKKITSGEIEFQNVSFKYNRNDPEFVLKGINLVIPKNKVTAIVGKSGSGKTTLLKLILKFFETNTGNITINGCKINQLDIGEWRSNCGVVMQDGYLFPNSISQNIVINNKDFDSDKLSIAIRVANLDDYINKLPLGLDTIVGEEGAFLSGGQKQRILIARAVYNNPPNLFFDEATSFLDSTNEKYIVQNLSEFFQHKTVVVIAHRLSTVKNADQIVVLDNGEIKEIGTHQELIQTKGVYFKLIEDQLELE